MAKLISTKPTLSTATEAQIRDSFIKYQLELKQRTCKLCSSNYKPTRSWQKFCSNSCRVMYFRLAKAVEEANWNDAKPKP